MNQNEFINEIQYRECRRSEWNEKKVQEVKEGNFA
jgi:hypothetical protein